MALIYQIFLPLFLFAFLVLSVKDIKTGIYAVIFLLPAYLLRFTLGGIPTTVLEIMIYILCAVWLIKNKHKLNIAARVKTFYAEEKILFRGIVLLFIGALLSTLFSADLRTSLGALKGWFVDPLLFFLVYIEVIRKPEEVRKTIEAYIFSAAVVALIALGYILFGKFTFDGRLSAFYPSPNYLAMYLAPAFLFSINLQAKGLSFNAALILLFLVLFLTRSAGTMFAIVIALGCMAWKRRKGRAAYFALHKKRVIAILIFLLVISVSLAWQKYELISNPDGRSSWSSRLMIWNTSLEILKDHPLVGIGPGTFQEQYLNYQNRFSVPYLEWAVPQPHDTLLAFYLQTGLIGLVGFLLLLLWLGKRARTDELVFLFLVYFLIHGLVDTLYWKNDLALLFWLVFAVGYADKAIGGKSDSLCKS
jgi:putative inorganic carbon (HCO3(-)) transporter